MAGKNNSRKAKKTKSPNCKSCLQIEGLADDATEMARTLREIYQACRIGAMTLKDPVALDPICRILMSCYVPFCDQYLCEYEKPDAVKRASSVIGMYGEEVIAMEAAKAAKKA